jgi:hypothetical protein
MYLQFLFPMKNKMVDFYLYFSNFWMPTVTAPMILYMFGIRINIKHYVISVFIGFCAIAIYRNISGDEFDFISQLVGMSFTIISMLIFHKTGVGKIALVKHGSKGEVSI